MTLVEYPTIGGFKVEGKTEAIINGVTDYDPYFGSQSAAVLGEWSWGITGEKIYFTENGKIKYTDGTTAYTKEQGNWKFDPADPRVLIIEFNGVSW